MAFREGRVLRHPLLHLRVYRRSQVSREPTAQAYTHVQSTLKGRSGSVRAAFVVPKKLGPATFRNKLRRRISEAYRRMPEPENHNASPNQALAGCDLIFLATPATTKATFAQFGDAISQLLHRANAETTKFGNSSSRSVSDAPKLRRQSLKGRATSKPAPS